MLMTRTGAEGAPPAAYLASMHPAKRVASWSCVGLPRHSGGEFMTDKTRDKRHTENGEDFRRFLHRLGGEEVSSDVSDALLGPFAVPSSSPFHGATFLIGKIVSNCRHRESPWVGRDVLLLSW